MGDPRVWGCQEHHHGEEELQNSFQEDSQAPLHHVDVPDSPKLEDKGKGML